MVLSLPEAEERETWGHPTFRVRDKMFATLSDDGRSATVDPTELRELLVEAWRQTAPKRLVNAYDAGQPGAGRPGHRR